MRFSRYRAFSGSTEDVSSVAFSPDGKRIVSGGAADGNRPAGMVTVWDFLSGQSLLTIKRPMGYVTSVAVSSDGKQIVAGSADKTARIWDAASGKDVLTLIGHDGEVTSVVFSPDGKRVVSGSADKTVRIWDAVGGKVLRTLAVHAGEVRSVAVSPDGRLIASGGGENETKIWDAANGKEVRAFSMSVGKLVKSVAFSADGSRIIIGCGSGRPGDWASFEVRETTTGNVLHNRGTSEGTVSSVAFSPDGTRFAKAEDKGIQVLLTSSGVGIHTLNDGFREKANEFAAIAFSPDGNGMVGGARNPGSESHSTLILWEVAGAQQELSNMQDYGTEALGLSPDGKRLVFGNVRAANSGGIKI
jgi:WD40 repeat protein